MSNINFNGIPFFFNILYSKKSTQDKADEICGVRKIEDGQNVRLVKNQLYELPASGATITAFNRKVDLESSKYKRKLANLRENEILTIGRADIDPSNSEISHKHFQIIRKGDSYFINDISEKGTTVTANGKFKNYNRQYLIQTYSNKQAFMPIIQKKYDSIRHASYPLKTTFPRCTPEEMQKAINTIEEPNFTGPQGNWMYRYIVPNVKKTYLSASEKDSLPERMSLNVVADPKLLTELDTLFQKGEYIDEYGRRRTIDYANRNSSISYKIPKEASDWTKRHDPITIYAGSKFSKATIDAVCAISRRYKRENPFGVPLLCPLSGNPQVSVEKIPIEEEFKEYIKKVDLIDANLARDIRSYVYEGWNIYEDWHDFNASTGMIAAIEAVVSEYCEYLNIK